MARPLFSMVVTAATAAAFLGASVAHAEPSLDSTFGNAGFARAAIGGSDDQAYDVAEQSDGRLIVVGLAWMGSTSQAAVARFTADGALDTSFGTGGFTTIDAGVTSSGGWRVLVRDDDSLVVGGYAFTDTGSDFALIGLSADGAVDTSFGTAGIVTTSFGPGDDGARALTMLPDGRIVAGGYASLGSETRFALAAYLSDGSLDASFGDGGQVTTNVSNDLAEIRALAVDGASSIYAAGFAEFEGGKRSEVALARYTPSGALDSAFQGAGLVTTAFDGFPFARGLEFVVDAQGRPVIGGWKDVGVTAQDWDFALARYTTDGLPDQTFGSAGRVVVGFGEKDEAIESLQLDGSGNVLAVGTSGGAYLVARFTDDGSLDDPGFTNTGEVHADGCPGSGQARGAVPTSDGKLVVVGSCFIGFGAELSLARFQDVDALAPDPTGSAGAGGSAGAAGTGGTPNGLAGSSNGVGGGGMGGSSAGASGNPVAPGPDPIDANRPTSPAGCGCRATGSPRLPVGLGVLFGLAAAGLLFRRRNTAAPDGS